MAAPERDACDCCRKLDTAGRLKVSTRGRADECAASHGNHMTQAGNAKNVKYDTLKFNLGHTGQKWSAKLYKMAVMRGLNEELTT